MAVEDNYPKKNAVLCIWLMRFWWGAKRRSGGERKKIPEEILKLSQTVCEGSFEWNGGRKGENELSIVITQACEFLLSV